MMRVCEKPSARAASTYSSSRTLSTCPRIIRATLTHMVRTMATNTCQNPFPNTSVIAKTSNSVGMLQITLMNHIMASSVRPLK